MARNWYVARTKPHSEYIAAEAFRREGYQHFLPRIRTIQRRTGKKEMPLFPGYIFIRCDVNRGRWPSIGLLPGILGWVRFDGVASPIPDHVVNELVLRVESINNGGGLWIKFTPGQRVRVVSGLFESLAWIEEEPTSSDSGVRVKLEFMGQLVSAQVPWSDLQVTPEEPPAFAKNGGRRTRGKGRWIRGLGSRAVAPSSRPG